MHALLIDGLNLIRRVHAGVPGDSASSEHADTVVGYFQPTAMGHLHSLGDTISSAGSTALGADNRYRAVTDTGCTNER